jgi:hypothetical protein
MVLIPPASARRHPVDLLLCGHHYLSSKAALAAAGAVVMDETGTIVDPVPRDRRDLRETATQPQIATSHPPEGEDSLARRRQDQQAKDL